MARVVGNRRRASGLAVSMVIAAALAAGATVVAQQQQYFVYMFAANEEGLPVRDLKADEVMMQEDGKPGRIVSVRPYSWPLKVTVLVDNHLASDRSPSGFGAGESFTGNTGALVHLRNSLTEFFEKLPRDVEVSLIATAPNPRWLVRPTSDPVVIRNGVNLITPDDFPGKFTDSLVEYGERLAVEFGRVNEESPQPYQPVLVVIGSTTNDGSLVRRDPVMKMLTQLRDYRVWTNFFMFTPSGVGADLEVGGGGNVLIGKAVQEVTGGRYDALTLAASSSLNRLLPELAQQIAGRHVRQSNQYHLLVERPDGVTGALKNLQFALSRDGVTYHLSADGSLP